MYLIVTRTFPPELGGMQNLMWGLARSLSKLNLIKVFADYHENHEEFDKSVSFSIERVSGMKLIRKYRKSYMINDYLDQNNKVECVIADHWKSLELVKTNKKKICLIHSKEINHPKGSSLNKRVLNVLNNVEKVIANSQFTKNLAIQCGVNENNIVVINPGIDPAKELDKKTMNKVESLLKVKTPRLITVSRFDKRKNHEKVIMALRNLKQNYPNPFNPSTVITYDLAGQGHVDLSIYNVVGKKVKTIVNKNETAGRKVAVWYGVDDSGNSLSAGMYFYRLTAGAKVFTKKMVLMK